MCLAFCRQVLHNRDHAAHLGAPPAAAEMAMTWWSGAHPRKDCAAPTKDGGPVTAEPVATTANVWAREAKVAGNPIRQLLVPESDLDVVEDAGGLHVAS